MDDRPIGIFDSGVGGLTVAKEIYKILPFEPTVYLGDTARVPYGMRSKETVIKFAKEDAGFLLSMGVKAIVIACNTVSAQAEEELRKMYDVPIFGMVEPAAKEAVRASRTSRLGVIGTAGTIVSKAYDRAIKRLNPLAQVTSQACPLLVPLIEDGRLKGPIIESVVAEYLLPFREQEIDTLILGCTHYPLISPVIYDFLWERVKLINPGEAVAQEVAAFLSEQNLAVRRTTLPSEKDHRQYFLTDVSESFKQTANQFLGEPVGEIGKALLD